MSDVFDANRMAPLLHIEMPYANQRSCAHEMLAHFRGDLRYVLLRAPLQSGKTGSYQYLIRLMLDLGVVDRAYVICGSHERELLEQVEQDVRDWHGARALNRTVHVLFRQHFKQRTMVTRRTLIVNDESHMDCQFDQQLDRFLTRHGLSMAGTTDAMRENGTYMVSVSATPFAEESVMAHGNSFPKALVRLQAGEGYYGPMDYYRDELLRKTYSVATGAGKADFVEEIRGVTGRGKYVIIRLCEGRVMGDKARRDARERMGLAVASAKENEVILDVLEEMEAAGQIRLLRFTSKYTKERRQVAITGRERGGLEIPCLEDAPEEPTVVLLDGRLRCGKRVPKKHIGMTWDTSIHSNVDVILQGLVGRMCGYRGHSDDPEKDVYYVPMDIGDRPVLYTSHNLFKVEEESVLPVSDLIRFADEDPRVHLVPRVATHLAQGAVEKVMKNRRGDIVHPCVPIRFFLPDEVVHHLPALSDGALREVCFDAFVSEVEFLVNENQDVTDEQRGEILGKLSQMNERGVHVRRLSGFSQVTFYRHLLDAIRDHTAVEKEQISDGSFITFCVLFEGYEGVRRYRSSDQAGTVYACIYTHAAGFLSTIPLPSRIPRHDGLTHFIHRAVAPAVEPALVPVAALAQAVEPALVPVAALAQAVEPALVPVAELEEKKEAPLEAVGVYGLTTDIQDSPEALYQQLSHFIELARSGLGYFGQEFTAVKGREGPRGIRLSLEAYGENLYVLRLLISRLEARYRVRITIQRNPPSGVTHVCLRRIRWEDA
jgi:hypothetical protein